MYHSGRLSCWLRPETRMVTVSPEDAAVSVLSSVLAAASLLLLASAVVCSDVVSFAGCEVQAQRAKSMATTRNSAICFFIW